MVKAVRHGTHTRAEHSGVVGGPQQPAVDEKSYADLYATEHSEKPGQSRQRDIRTAKETAE